MSRSTKIRVGLWLTLLTLSLGGKASAAIVQVGSAVGVAGDVVRLVMKGGMILVLTGGVIGVALAFAVTRLLEGFLLGVSGTDAGTFVSVPLVLIAVAVVAAYLPARRASRINPMEALRRD